MKLAYITAEDPHDINGWSGLSYYIAESVRRQGAEFEYLGPLGSKDSLGMKIRRRWYRMLGKRMLEIREPSIVKSWGRQAMAKMKNVKADAIFCTHTEYLSEFQSDLPIAYFSDSNFGCMLDAYPQFDKLPAATIQRAHDWERRALHRANLIIYACDWARDAAIDIYGVDPDKIKVLPFGANIECDRTDEQVAQLIEQRPTDHCHLLFLGKRWKRKGGDTVVAVTEELNRRGLPTTLTLIGSEPPRGQSLPDCVRRLGFINKADPDGLKLFNDTIAGSHFLIVPSRAEAFGIVFCEAASFGVPSVATKAGGIPTAVRSGGNGETFPPDSSPAVYADFIENHFKDYDRYRGLAHSAWNEYKTRLNWDVTGKRAYGYLQEMIKNFRK